jgi:hypothetical protein
LSINNRAEHQAHTKWVKIRVTFFLFFTLGTPEAQNERTECLGIIQLSLGIFIGSRFNFCQCVAQKSRIIARYD